ncbi:hypothetical protein [Streptomyces longisporus]|uniref:Uncharacterized protein n=1 Tax=Streptomyces longisporus TaxID=1948 RepID=A0ABN3LNC5_STRLO
MQRDMPPRYSPEGTPLGRTADDLRFSTGYSTRTPRARKLWWRIRGVLRRPVKNSTQSR